MATNTTEDFVIVPRKKVKINWKLASPVSRSNPEDRQGRIDLIERVKMRQRTQSSSFKKGKW